MKLILKTILFSYIITSIISCNKNAITITSKKDYNQYLSIKENKKVIFLKSEINFWQNKFNKAPNQISYLSLLASNYSALFESTCNIDFLYKAEKLLLKSIVAYQYSEVGTLRSLARNYISQHRFQEALVLANKALSIGEGKKETQKILFDVNMELGNYTKAEANLKSLNDISDFDYLIRVSKWNDHKGDLKTAISLMEKANQIANQNENKNLKIWTLSNLGDLNGHDGNIKKSYDYYLKTLEIDPNNSYALKGISWIVFSYEKNTQEANRIIESISKKHNTPDFYLIKAEIAEFEGNQKEKERNLVAYFQMLENSKYGAMYNKYNALIYADNSKTANKALEIANIEIARRPTPESYDLLAWAYFNLGNFKKANEITLKYVYGKSFEPELNYHVASIFKANENIEKYKTIKKDLLKSTYELGPNFESKIIDL